MSRRGKRCVRIINEAAALPERVRQYLAAAKPVFHGVSTPGHYATQSAAAPQCDLEQVSIDDLREMMNDVACGLVERGIEWTPVEAVVRRVMEENQVPWRMRPPAN